MKRSALTFTALLILIACLFIQADAAPLYLKGTIVTMDEGLTVIKGGIAIEGGIIKAVHSGDDAPEGALVIDTAGYIYPGLINLHNHLAYDFLPLYEIPKAYTNRYQWSFGKNYNIHILHPHSLVMSPDMFDLGVEAVKYAEIKSLVGGVTTEQGCPGDNSDFGRGLVRNVESPDFPHHALARRTAPLDQTFVDDLAREKERIAASAGWLFHLAEGTDALSRREYDNGGYDPARAVSSMNMPDLIHLGLVTDKLVGIHSVALTAADYRDWKHRAPAGPKIVWSPLSNLLLYGQTANVPAAIDEGALVAIGTDWSPSGSKNLLWELKIADQVNNQKFHHRISPRDLVRMVTSTPALMVGWRDVAGSLETGKAADLLVIHSANPDPYRALIEALESQVALVVIGGDPLYGDEDIMARLRTKGDYEDVPEAPPEGGPKAIAVKNPGIPGGTESYAEIKDLIWKAARLDATLLAETLNGARRGTKSRELEHIKASSANLCRKKHHTVPANLVTAGAPITPDQVRIYLESKYPGAGEDADPIYQQDDKRWFDRVERNLYVKPPINAWDPAPLRTYVH
jgi:5-methylthioadenosine/S-adenosylhomocysteine deaminase